MTSGGQFHPPSNFPPAGGTLAPCEHEASRAHAVETTLGVQGLGVLRERERIVTELARTVDGADPFAAAVRAAQMAMVITDPLQDDNPIVFVNNAFCDLTGYPRDEILGRNCRFLQEPDTDRAEIARLRDAIEKRVPVEALLLNRRKDGGVFWNRLFVAPVFQGADLAFWVASRFDATSKKARLDHLETDREALARAVERRTRDLSESEERLRFVLQAGRLGSWALDLADMRFIASDTFKCMLGRSPKDPLSGGEFTALIHEDDRARRDEAVAASIAGRGDYDIEYRIATESGEVWWLKIRGPTVLRHRWSAVETGGHRSRRETDRKQEEAHRGLLANEFNHHVKYTLATVQAIVTQTLRSSLAHDESRDVIQRRIHSLAVASDVLTRDSWDGATLHEVATTALAPFRAEGDRSITIRGSDAVLTP
jgi:PAS domain S-box-containing protein